MRKLVLFLVLLPACLLSVAGTVDTVSIYSNAMHKNFKAVVIKPTGYKLNNPGYETFICYMAMAAVLETG